MGPRTKGSQFLFTVPRVSHPIPRPIPQKNFFIFRDSSTLPTTPCSPSVAATRKTLYNLLTSLPSTASIYPTASPPLLARPCSLALNDFRPEDLSYISLAPKCPTTRRAQALRGRYSNYHYTPLTSPPPIQMILSARRTPHLPQTPRQYVPSPFLRPQRREDTSPATASPFATPPQSSSRPYFSRNKSVRNQGHRQFGNECCGEF